MAGRFWVCYNTAGQLAIFLESSTSVNVVLEAVVIRLRMLIGVGCASMLIKYHQGLQHVDHFSYRHHPLTTLKLDDVIKGKMCLESIDDGPINGCAPCEF
ncbi:hypothetical protein WN943_023724 [Citrus x changshan-huyou]